MDTIVINLIGGPGSGKSTAAAGIFYKLKMMGYVCELVTEYAKDKVWDSSYTTLDDQIYVFGHQYHRLWRLNGKVQFIITDSPILLSAYFSKLHSKTFNDFIIETYKTFTNATFLLKRSGDYQQAGRLETADEAINADNGIKTILDNYNLEYEEVDKNKAVDYIVGEITKYFAPTKDQSI